MSIAFVLISFAFAASAEDRISAAEFSKHVLDTADLVLKRHMDPPPKQVMVAEAIRALTKKADNRDRFGLGRTVSELKTDGALLQFVADSWNEAHRTPTVSDQELQLAAIEGLLRSLPGRPGLLPPKEAKVQAQIRGNRYVGIGIQIGMDKESGDEVPIIINPFQRGPARVAGAKPGDRILEIDGVSTAGMTLEAVVGRLRGEEGTSITMVVQAAREEAKRTLTMTRGVIPFPSFAGFNRLSEEEWAYRPDESQPIAYLHLSGIRASALSELRRLAPILEAAGNRGLIVDLRLAGSGASNDVQHAVLLADELLEEGPVGVLTDVSGTPHEYRSGPDCLFRKWPIVVLVNQYTSGEPEFLAAALQDNRRAVVVGERTRAMTLLHTSFDLPGNLGAVMLPTGVLSRADGRALHRMRTIGDQEDGPDARPPATVAPAAHDESDHDDWGVRPDHTVAMTPDQLHTWSAWRQQQDLPEPPPAGRAPRPADPQLDKAMEILQRLLDSTRS